ncbi:MAG TPA: carboxymuconolactone decarboxylase family protein [Amycolatopsis sp.]|nr:carboxymuconolactone decarboxylase family protein [Amycolatopsis sp.]
MRMKNPAVVLPGAMKGIQGLLKATAQGGVPRRTLELVGLRASQINGCGACVAGHFAAATKAGETGERLAAVAVWRHTPFFTEAERAALALTEAVTRLADSQDEAVSDEIRAEAAAHHDEAQLAAIVLMIATVDLFDRLNVTVGESADHPSWA